MYPSRHTGHNTVLTVARRTSMQHPIPGSTPAGLPTAKHAWVEHPTFMQCCAEAFPSFWRLPNYFWPSANALSPDPMEARVRQQEACSRYLGGRCVCCKCKAVGAVCRIGLGSMRQIRRRRRCLLCCAHRGPAAHLQWHTHQWLVSQTWNGTR